MSDTFEDAAATQDLLEECKLFIDDEKEKAKVKCYEQVNLLINNQIPEIDKDLAFKINKIKGMEFIYAILVKHLRGISKI